MRNTDVLRAGLVAIAVLTAICVNAVPIIYAFSPWRTRLLGRLFMYQAMAFAFAIDVSVLFILIRPSIVIRYWISAFEMTLIAGTSFSLAQRIWRMQHPKIKQKRKGLRQVQFTDPVYNKLKFIALILLPALAALYFGLSKIWDLPHTTEVMGTITLIDTFLGSLLKVSTSTYNSGVLPQPKIYDGTVVVEPGDGGDQLRISGLNPEAAVEKDEFVLKVIRTS